MPFSAIGYLFAQRVALMNGVPAAEANRLGVFGAILRPPLGILASSVIARREAPSPTIPALDTATSVTELVEVKSVLGYGSARAEKELGSDISVLLVDQGGDLVIDQIPEPGSFVPKGTRVVLFMGQNAPLPA